MKKNYVVSVGYSCNNRHKPVEHLAEEDGDDDM